MSTMSKFSFFQSWGGDANGFGLAHCSMDLPADVREIVSFLL